MIASFCFFLDSETFGWTLLFWGVCVAISSNFKTQDFVFNKIRVAIYLYTYSAHRITRFPFLIQASDKLQGRGSCFPEMGVAVRVTSQIHAKLEVCQRCKEGQANIGCVCHWAWFPHLSEAGAPLSEAVIPFLHPGQSWKGPGSGASETFLGPCSICR